MLTGFVLFDQYTVLSMSMKLIGVLSRINLRIRNRALLFFENTYKKTSYKIRIWNPNIPEGTKTLALQAAMAAVSLAVGTGPSSFFGMSPMCWKILLKKYSWVGDIILEVVWTVWGGTKPNAEATMAKRPTKVQKQSFILYLCARVKRRMQREQESRWAGVRVPKSENEGFLGARLWFRTEGDRILYASLHVIVCERRCHQQARVLVVLCCVVLPIYATPL